MPAGGLDLARVRDALEAILEQQATDWTAERAIVDSPTTPSAMVGYPSNITYGSVLSQRLIMVQVDLPIVLAVAGGDKESAQAALDEALSVATRGSIVSVVHGATSPAWGACVVTGANNIGQAETDGGTSLIVADITLTIRA